MVVRTGAGSFPELGDAAWGARGRWLVVALQWSGYYLGAVAQIAYMGASWDQTFRGQAWAAGVCQSQWMGVTALCLWPFMMVPSFTAFQGLALFSSLAAVFLTLVYLGQIAAFGAYAAGGGPCYDQWTTVRDRNVATWPSARARHLPRADPRAQEPARRLHARVRPAVRAIRSLSARSSA